jgi:hypothetical protein
LIRTTRPSSKITAPTPTTDGEDSGATAARFGRRRRVFLGQRTGDGNLPLHLDGARLDHEIRVAAALANGTGRVEPLALGPLGVDRAAFDPPDHAHAAANPALERRLPLREVAAQHSADAVAALRERLVLLERRRRAI